MVTPNGHQAYAHINLILFITKRPTPTPHTVFSQFTAC